MNKLISVGEAARRLNMSVDTVRELERTGELRASRTPGGHRRFKAEVVDDYLARQRMATRPEADDLRESTFGDSWDDSGEVEHSVPRRVVPMHPQGTATSTDPLARAVDQHVERARLDGLKAHGRAQIPFNASARARSAAIDAMESYVTVGRFPASMPWWDARRAIEAKVAAVLEPFTAEAARPTVASPAPVALSPTPIPDNGRAQRLIAHGTSRAFFATISWDRDDAEEARADVLEALEEELDSESTERDVSELVDEILDEWEEESEE